MGAMSPNGWIQPLCGAQRSNAGCNPLLARSATTNGAIFFQRTLGTAMAEYQLLYTSQRIDG